jgi:MFS family permease
MTALTTSPAPAAGAGSPRSQASLPGSQAGSPRRPRITLIVGSLAGFMIGLDASVVTTALPTIHATLHASASTLGWTVSAYSLAFAALILTGTALGDLFGRRRVFLAGFALFTLASAACALAPSAAWLIAARAVQGAGGGIATPLSLVLITEAFPIQRRGAVVGAWGAITGVAVGFGPVIGGAIVQGIAWPWVFWVNVPIGIILVTLGRRLLAESCGVRLDVDGPSPVNRLIQGQISHPASLTWPWAVACIRSRASAAFAARNIHSARRRSDTWQQRCRPYRRIPIMGVNQR